MERLKKTSITLLSMLTVAGVALGVERAMHSKLFTLQVIEVESTTDDPPLDEETIVQLTGIPLGKISLFDLDLIRVEKRLLANDLIRRVKLQKKVPQTLSVAVTFREPQAVIQNSKGALAFVDDEGKAFGSMDLLKAPDLAVLSGTILRNPEKIREALRLLSHWEKSPLHRVSLISSVFWEPERGFRILVAYPLGGGISSGQGRVRTMIDLGYDVDANLDGRLVQLSSVFRYLSGNSIAVRQVWADAGKKVVVKTAGGS